MYLLNCILGGMGGICHFSVALTCDSVHALVKQQVSVRKNCEGLHWCVKKEENGGLTVIRSVL